MTTDEIKETLTMRDVLERYGVSVNRHGMCRCPIHGERHPSMKVYPDGYKCFACNSGGDIFRFVMDMEHCDFKTAFKLLGGTYTVQRNDTARKVHKAQIARRKSEKERKEQAEKEFRTILMGSIDLCNFWLSNREPLSDDWCYAQNTVQWLWHVYDTKYIEGEEVNEIDVLGKYKQIRQKFVTG